MYKQQNINIDPEWLHTFSNTTNEHDDEEDLHITNNNNVTDIADDEENNNEEDAPSINTLVTDNTIDPNKDILCIAPAEGQKSIFTDKDTEYLCFPTIFYSQKHQNNKYQKLTKSKIFK